MIGIGVVGQHGAIADLPGAHDKVVFFLVTDSEFFVEIAEIGHDLW